MDNKKNILKKYKVEIIVYLIYVIGVSVVSAFHEPWFDEAQAWQIARSASLKEILFEIPHYEGHPQLWHLILVPFAKLGAPYLFSIKFVNIAFCAAAMFLLIFKSPFPRLLRCVLPFNYYFFYHFGVLSRPYSMMLLALFLMAITYKKRDEKPLPFVLSMAFLCATQLYGIVIAGMVSVAWVINIFLSYKDNKKGVFKDKRCYILLGLLIFALLIIVAVMPRSDTYNPSFGASFRTRMQQVLSIPMLPFEALWGMSFTLDYFQVTEPALVIEGAFGAAIYLAILKYGKKIGHALEFLLPSAAFIIFYTQCYSSYYHLGLLLAFFIYFFWTTIDCGGDECLRSAFEKLKLLVNSPLLKKLGAAMTGVVLFFPVVQSIVPSIRDIIHPYCYSAALAEYIKKYNLDELKILGEWDIDYPSGYGSASTEEEKEAVTNEEKLENRQDRVLLCGVETALMPYLDTNPFINFGNKDGSDTFSWYKQTGSVKEYFEKWAEEGLPDVIICEADLELIYSEEELETVKYVRIEEFPKYMQFKLVETETSINIYMREDLLDEYGIEAKPFLEATEDKFTISDTEYVYEMLLGDSEESTDSDEADETEESSETEESDEASE